MIAWVRTYRVHGFQAAIGLALLLGASKGNAQDSDELLERAYEAWERGDRAEASALTHRIQEGSNDEGRSLRRALIFARTAADAEEALSRWETVLSLEPPDETRAEALEHRGEAAVALSQFDLAREEYSKLAKLPKNAIDRGSVELAQGLCELEGGEPRASLEWLGQATKHDMPESDRSRTEIALASAHYRLGNLQEALRRFSRFEKEHAKDSRGRWAAWRKVLCLRHLGNASDASDATEKLEKSAPGSLEALLARQEVQKGSSMSSVSTPRDRNATKVGADEGAKEKPQADGKAKPTKKKPDAAKKENDAKKEKDTKSKKDAKKKEGQAPR